MHSWQLKDGQALTACHALHCDAVIVLPHYLNLHVCVHLFFAVTVFLLPYYTYTFLLQPSAPPSAPPPPPPLPPSVLSKSPLADNSVLLLLTVLHYTPSASSSSSSFSSSFSFSSTEALHSSQQPWPEAGLHAHCQPGSQAPVQRQHQLELERELEPTRQGAGRPDSRAAEGEGGRQTAVPDNPFKRVLHRLHDVECEPSLLCG